MTNDYKGVFNDLAIARDVVNDAIPDEKAALLVLDAVYDRLIQLGFMDAELYPKDSSPFEAIIVGEPNIVTCYYKGKWPTGVFYMVHNDRNWPCRPILLRKPK